MTAALAGTALANTPRTFEIDLNTKGAKDTLKTAEGQYIYLLEERQATVSSVRKILKVGGTENPASRMAD